MTGHNPRDRSKLGSKRHILTDKNGIPLSTFITPANTHDVTIARNTIDNIVIKKPSSKSKHKPNLCIYNAYHSKEVEQEIIKKGRYSIYTSQKKGRNQIIVEKSP